MQTFLESNEAVLCLDEEPSVSAHESTVLSEAPSLGQLAALVWFAEHEWDLVY